jgi:predicted RNA-binding Zn-ribbon protein involved in translation (DUF1610 family)
MAASETWTCPNCGKQDDYRSSRLPVHHTRNQRFSYECRECGHVSIVDKPPEE